MPTTHESTHRQVAASACIAEPSTPLLASRRPRTSTSRALRREAPSVLGALCMFPPLHP